jgi:hypothetical protein
VVRETTGSTRSSPGKYCHVVSVTIDGVLICSRIYSTLTIVTTEHRKTSQSLLAVAWWRFPTVNIHLPLGSRTVPGLNYQLLTATLLSQSQSQSYFATGGLPPISSFWRQAPWDSRPEYFFQLMQPPLWSSGQSSWLQIQRSRDRFPALSEFLRSSGSGTGSTQPRKYNWGATWMQLSWTTSPRYIALARTAQKTFLPLLRDLSLPGKTRVQTAVP